MMEEYFNRQIKLWGETTQESLKKKHILIVGCGGLGSSLAISLGSSGIGKVTLVDFDTVGIHNIHRQIAFKITDENRKKCDVVKELLLSRYPNIEVSTYDIPFEEFTSLPKDNTIDLILDATDNLPSRDTIDKYAKSINTPWIYGSVEEFHGYVCFFEKTNFDDVMTITERTPGGIACPIVMNIASLQANFAIRYLTSFPIQKDILHYIYFDEEGKYTLKHFKL